MYNSLSRLPVIPYNIITYLAQNNEIIWKLLKYNDYNSLKNPNLTMSEKLSLIWKEGKQDDYSIFLTQLVEDAVAESKNILKVYDYYIHANSLYYGTVVYAFDILYGGKMSMVDYNGYPVSRGDLMINQLLETLNGAEVGGVGKLVFDNDMSRYDLGRSVVGNSKTFTGYQLFMSVNVGDTGKKDTGCVD